VRVTNRRRWRTVIALFAVTAVVFTACGSDGGDENGGATTTPGSKADPNGVIKVGYDLQQEGLEFSFDPRIAKAAGTANDSLFNLVYGRLMQVDKDGNLTPDLATKAAVVDVNTISVELREGLEFSDGTPLDSAAVKASLERYLGNRAENEVAFLTPYFSLETIEVESATKLTLKFPDGTANRWFDQHIMTWKTSITKPGATFEAIGAGPFKIENYTPGQKIVMTKNDSYWNADALKVKGMEFSQVAFAQPQAGIAAVRQGQFDITTTDPSQLGGLSGDIEPVSRVSPDSTMTMMVCKKDGPLADVRVRQALNKGIDRETINEAVFGGTSEPATQMYPTGHKFNNPDVDKDLAFDPEGAKKLLKDAGYADGVSIDLYPLDFAGLLQAAEVIKDQLADVGITINLKTGTNFVTDYLQPDRNALGLYPGNNSGVEKLTSWTGNSLGNICEYKDAEIDDYFAKLSTMSESDPDATEIWHQAAEKVVDEALSVFVLFRATLGAYDSSRLGDLTPMVLGQYIVPDPFKTYVKG
jgi:peptide/nickel transport system substrate-binding protein